MKCCCSRPTLAIIIGLVHTLSNLALAIYSTMNLVQLGNLPPTDDVQLKVENSLILSFSLVTIVLSVVMIVGVVSKRYMLMAPYLWLCAIGMGIYVIVHVLAIGIVIYSLGASAATAVAVLSIIIRLVLVIGIQILIMYPIFTLYKEWRVEATTGVAPQIYGTAPILYQNIYGNEKMPVNM